MNRILGSIYAKTAQGERLARKEADEAVRYKGLRFLLQKLQIQEAGIETDAGNPKVTFIGMHVKEIFV